MFGYAVEARTGRVHTGELDYVWHPTNPRTTATAQKCGLIMLHGSGSPNEYVDTVNQLASVQLSAAIASAGIPCVAGDMGLETWGNDTLMTRIGEAWSLLQTMYPIRSDKVCLMGASMGGAGVMRYSQLNPTKVAAIVALIPLTDLVGYYTSNTGGAQVAIATAWGVTAPAALPSSANVAANYAAAVGIPHLFGYSNVDPLIFPSTVVSYSENVGARSNTYVTDTRYGHSDAAIAGMPIQTVIDFLKQNGA